MINKKQVTIRQVARAARVSSQTVSRVINDRPDVAPDTRRRVQEVIRKLVYRPNALARSLIRQRSHSMGVVAMAGEFYGPSHTLVGIEQKIRQLGYTLLLDLLHHPETENVERILNRLLSQQVDGIIWAVPEIGNNRAWLSQKKLRLSVPMIFTNMAVQPGLSIVAIDNQLGGCLATRHLIEKGYRQIGIITGPLDWWEARQRKLGWEEALQAAGLPVDPRFAVEGNWSASSGEQCIRRLVEQFPEIQAIFASNDQMALGVLQATHAAGRRVPDDLGVVGFDNIPESAYFWPALSTIEQPLIELGHQAVQRLSQIIDAAQQDGSPVKPELITLTPSLVVRQSSLPSWATSPSA